MFRWFYAKLREAAGSTSRCASPSLPIPGFGFGKANIKSILFGSFDLLLLLESHQKLKQRGPKLSLPKTTKFTHAPKVIPILINKTNHIRNIAS
jgi:hypothetical protein